MESFDARNKPMIFYCLLFTVLLSPLPFGANRAWSWSLWALIIAVLAIAWAISVIKNSKNLQSLQCFNSIRPLIIIFSGVLIWSILQTFATNLAPHPLWELTSQALNIPVKASISLTPDDSITSMMRILSYALVFFLSFYYCQSRQKAKQVFISLMVVGGLFSLYGLIIHLGDYQLILWFKKWSSMSSLSSTFVNHNHFATYAGLTLLCSLALIHQSINHSIKYHIGGSLGLQRFVDRLITDSWLPLLLLIIIGSALISSNSRGGFLSIISGILVLLSALHLNKRANTIYILRGSLILLFIIGLIFYLSSDGLISNIQKRGLYDHYRADVYALTWEAIMTNPWAGFGLGSFEEVFKLYKTLDITGNIRGPFRWDYAHNAYLETMFELGIPAALALFYCFFQLGWICFKGLFIRKRDWFYPATGLAATTLIAVHSVVDFSMQIPAVVYTYCLLMGAACAQSFSHSKHHSA